jgi:adenine-specific DNA-methyltransferase
MRKEMKKSCKLELTWPGKEDWEKPEPRLLLEKSTCGTKKGAEDNLLIYGDNLLGLKALERDYTGKVKCVYIDPPYNTKSCFAHYDDSMEHSLWLNMMKERLIILRRLLRNDGTIWISIDDDECHYLKVLCDEIFGRRNFVANVIWEKKYSPQNDAKWLSDSHDHILVYAKCIELKHWGNNVKKGLNLLPRTEKMDNRYKNPDEDPRGVWQSGDLSVKRITPKDIYPILTPSGREIWPPDGRSWAISKEKFKKLIKDNRIWFGPEKNNTPRLKRFLSEVQNGTVAKTLWPRLEVGDNQESKREVIALNSKDVFPTPKPERLIQRILHLATHPGDLVLDCFAGSGTTGAVAHKTERRWIMIEMNSHCQTHILPRLQKVIEGTDQGGITEIAAWKGGGGFRYCELAPSLLEKNKFNRWTINKKYNPVMLIEAICLHAGYTFNPKREPWWMHGQSTENDFIFVTASTLTRNQLTQMSHELGESQSLLVYCGAFKADPKEFDNLTIRKIPKSILNRCEWGRDDYSLKVALQEEAKEANKKKSRKQQVTSGSVIRMPMAAKGS